jgi:hypothetical protein
VPLRRTIAVPEEAASGAIPAQARSRALLAKRVGSDITS